MRTMNIITLLLVGAGLASVVWVLVHSSTLDHELYRSVRLLGKDDLSRNVVDIQNNRATFSVAQEKRTHLEIRPDDNGKAVVHITLAHGTIVHNAILERDESIAFDGKKLRDTRGQEWELFGRDLSRSPIYQQHPEYLLSQGIWFGEVQTDGRSIFFDVGIGKKGILETWKLIAK